MLDEVCAVRSCLLHADRDSCDRPVSVRIFTWLCPEAIYKSTKADARNGIEFRGTAQCDPTGSCYRELKHRVQRKRMVKGIFVSIGKKFLEVTLENLCLE